MGKIRLHAILLAALMLAGCFTFPYEYVELTGDNVTVTKTDRPSVDAWHRGGDRIPLSYTLEEPGVSLTITVGTLSAPPNLEIASSVPIRGVSVGNAVPRRRSPFEYSVEWWNLLITLDDPEASHAGEVVQIMVDLESRTDPVIISGVIARSGKTTYFDLSGP